MAFSAIVDVVRKILEEPVPENRHPILALAKTDLEKQLKSKSEADKDEDKELDHLPWSKSERNAWIRQSWKKPIAAAGVRQPPRIPGTSANVPKFSDSEFACEKARERRLRRQATQGVVALFNAVREHQTTISKQLNAAAPLEYQKEKIVTGYTASDFLDRLSAGLPGIKPKKKEENVSDPEPPRKKAKRNPFPGATCSVKIERN